ncbi:MAG TPA: PrsW family glutamic-type intramembrane protease [Phycisphaerae bacterium]|nr:PrsW family glutamic-type intramembrane protease [Phycisphaerae bacterium]
MSESGQSNEPADPVSPVTPQGNTEPTRRPQRRTEKTYETGQSIFDEPDIFPGRQGEVLDRDWSCDYCGANLRGMPLETPCRECGKRNWYRPPPLGANSYESWLVQKQQETKPGTGIAIALACAMVGGLFAVISSALGTSPGGFMGASLPLLIIVFGPLVEETMKVAAASYIVEVKPYLFKRSTQVYFAAIGAAFIFAALENVLYIFVYLRNPSDTIILFRWTVCVALHVGCTTIVALGLGRIWTRAMSEFRQPRIADLFPSLVTAIILHGTYNAGVIGLERLYPWIFK